MRMIQFEEIKTPRPTMLSPHRILLSTFNSPKAHQSLNPNLPFPHYLNKTQLCTSLPPSPHFPSSSPSPSPPPSPPPSKSTPALSTPPAAPPTAPEPAKPPPPARPPASTSQATAPTTPPASNAASPHPAPRAPGPGSVCSLAILAPGNLLRARVRGRVMCR